MIFSTILIPFGLNEKNCNHFLVVMGEPMGKEFGSEFILNSNLQILGLISLRRNLNKVRSNTIRERIRVNF